MSQQEESSQNRQRFELILSTTCPDLHRVFQCMETIRQFGGNGSISIHMVDGFIKKENGIYIQPGFKDNIVVTEVYIKKQTRIEKYDGAGIKTIGL